LLIPLVRVSLTPEAMMRFRGTSVFGQQNELYELAAQRREGLGLVFDNRRWVDIGVVLRNYLTHFDPVWLFLNSGRENHKVPSLGLFYLWELPLMLVGIYALIRLPISRRVKYLFLGWILIAPVPASITTQAPHAMRSFNVLPVPMILSAIGLVTLINHWRKRGLWFLVFGVSLLFFYQQYFVNFPREQSDSFQYPLAGAVRYALAEENKYQKIVFTNQGQGYQSYMSYLLFSQYDPKVYQQQGGTVMGGYNEVHEIGKYEFRPINWLKEAKDGTVLYIGEVDDFPNETKRQENFYFLNRQPGLVAVK
jgi:hypothetical protein